MYKTDVIIMDGVQIADGVIIGAGAVVTKDLPPYAIAGGVPAKIIRYRFEKEEISQLLLSKWWDLDIDFLKNNFEKFHDIDIFLTYNQITKGRNIEHN